MALVVAARPGVADEPEVIDREIEQSVDRLLQAVLVRRARSQIDAVHALDLMESSRNRLLARDRKAGHHLAAIVAAEEFMLAWAHRNSAFLPPDRYRALVERVERREPLGPGRRLFDLGALPFVARFVRQLEPGVVSGTDCWARITDLQPLSEIELRGNRWPDGAAIGDRLTVHVGALAYRGALVIASTEDDAGRTECFMARLLELETADHGALLRVSDDGEDGIFLARRGTVTVECVVFDRPGVLRA